MLPDGLTQPLLWSGLIFHGLGGGVSLEQGLWGAVLGYLMLAGVYWGFRGWTKREGMGLGDVKLLAVIGAWMGAAQLPLILMGAASLGVVGGLCLGWRKGRNIAFPFGPFMVLAAECILWMNLQGRGA
ncbi:type IV prepilin leader peptidase [mine drainage metagenome]|uniref:Type IV prepilin leader peptidase n=1 Tax=mine drainage metagenome TaxID=410659 RepID=T0YJP7_9ZZZZ